MKKPKVLFKKLKALYFFILIILDLIIAKLKTFFLKNTALIDFSREFIDKEEINIFLRKYNYQNHNKFKNFTNDKLEIAINYPYQFGIYNLSELVIDILKNNLLNKNELKVVSRKCFSIIWKYREKNFLSNNHLLNNYRALLYLSSYKSNTKKNKLIIRIVDLYERIFNFDGTSKEGSTSYFFLKTYWLCDLVDLIEGSEYYSDLHLNLLKERMRLSLSVAHLILKCTANNQFSIGDITPDIPSRDLVDLIKSYLKKHNVRDGIYVSSRSSIHYQTNQKNHITLCRKGNYKNNVIQDHSHLDISSITWVHDNIPILVDPGRNSYDKRFEKSNQIIFENHNTIFTDKENFEKEFPTLAKNKLHKSLSYFNDDLSFNENIINYKLKGRFYTINRIIDISKKKYLLVKDEIKKFNSSSTVFFNWNLHPNFLENKLIIKNSFSGCKLDKNKYLFSDDYSNLKEGLKISGKFSDCCLSLTFEHGFEYLDGSLIYNLRRKFY